jgi:hypothetical protein
LCVDLVDQNNGTHITTMAPTFARAILRKSVRARIVFIATCLHRHDMATGRRIAWPTSRLTAMFSGRFRVDDVDSLSGYVAFGCRVTTW